MKSTEDQTQSLDTADAAPPVRLASPMRRRLLRGGMIGAPALLALKSTPVMACNCTLPSGFSVSGNASHNIAKTCTSPGYKPTYWQTRCNTAGCYTGSSCYKTENFSKYFTCNSTYTDKTLHNCLGSDTDHRGMAVACYLQGCSEGGSHFPLASTVKDVWNLGVIGNNYPVPGSTAVWNKTQSLAYLRYLTGQQPA